MRMTPAVANTKWGRAGFALRSACSPKEAHYPAGAVSKRTTDPLLFCRSQVLLLWLAAATAGHQLPAAADSAGCPAGGVAGYELPRLSPWPFVDGLASAVWLHGQSRHGPPSFRHFGAPENSWEKSLDTVGCPISSAPHACIKEQGRCRGTEGAMPNTPMQPDPLPRRARRRSSRPAQAVKVRTTVLGRRP